jgi:hypothetical protein
MSSSEKIDLYRDFAAGDYLSEAQNSIPPPPFTHCIRVYSILHFTQRTRGGGELNQREGERSNSSHCWVENTNITYCISPVYKL